MGVLSNIWRNWELSLITVFSLLPLLLVASGSSALNSIETASSISEAFDLLQVGISQLYVALALLTIICFGLAYLVRKLAIRVDKLEQSVVEAHQD